RIPPSRRRRATPARRCSSSRAASPPSSSTRSPASRAPAAAMTSAISLSSHRVPDDPRLLLAAILECSSDAVVAETLAGEITVWSASAERVFGYSAAEVCGHSIELLVQPDKRDELADVQARIRRRERVEQLTTVRRRKDGTLIDVVVTAAPILDARGELVGVSTTTRDVTEQHAQERGRAELELGLSWESHRLL